MNTLRDLELSQALGACPPGSLVAIVGGGGKTTLLFALSRCLRGRVVLTTTTRIFAAQIEAASAHCLAPATPGSGSDGSGISDRTPSLADALAAGESGLLVIGAVEGEKALGVASSLPAQLLEHPAVDYVVVEADGSRMRPTKAPANHEPVIPQQSTLVVIVAGIDALNSPISEATHRPERVCGLTGLTPSESLTPEALGQLLSHPRGGLQGVPDGARIVVLLNKVESEGEAAAAQIAAEGALECERIDRVVVGSLHTGDCAEWTAYTRSSEEVGG